MSVARTPFALAAVLLALLPAVLASGGTASKAPASALFLKPVCFTKTQVCCYRFAKCGYATRVVTLNKPCPYKKCTKHCKLVCALVRKRVAEKYNYCTLKKVKVTPLGLVYKLKKVCVVRVRYVWKKVKVCKNVCRPKCVVVPATCITKVLYKYAKYCPKLHCAKVVGVKPLPKTVVSKRGKIVKVLARSRVPAAKSVKA